MGEALFAAKTSKVLKADANEGERGNDVGGDAHVEDVDPLLVPGNHAGQQRAHGGANRSSAVDDGRHGGHGRLRGHFAGQIGRHCRGDQRVGPVDEGAGDELQQLVQQSGRRRPKIVRVQLRRKSNGK